MTQGRFDPFFFSKVSYRCKAAAVLKLTLSSHRAIAMYDAGSSRARASQGDPSSDSHPGSNELNNTSISGDGLNKNKTNSSSSKTGQANRGPTTSSYPNTEQNRYVYCPYHGVTIQMPIPLYRQGQQLGPMERFLAEGPSVQPSLLIREDNGRLSTARECGCRARIENLYRRSN